MSEILTIQFSGRAVSRRKLDENSIKSKESKDDFINRNEIVPWLDSHSDYIAEDIEREIKKALPPGVQVNVNIEFNYGRTYAKVTVEGSRGAGKAVILLA